MKRIIVIGLVMILSLTSYSFSEEQVIATVGNHVLTKKDLNIMLMKILPYVSFHRNITGERLKKYKKKAFVRLIERTLVVIDGASRVKVTKEEIEKKFNDIIQRFPSKAEFKKALTQAGETEKSLKRRLRDDIIFQKTVDLMINKPSRVTEAEARAYYDKNRDAFHEPERLQLREIFISVPANATAAERKAKKALIEDIYRRLKEGEGFGELAYRFSQDKYRFVSGKLKEIHRGRLDPEIEKIIDKTPEGSFTPPIETIYGYYIFLVEKRLPGRQLSFQEVKDKLIRQLSRKKRAELKKRYISKLKERIPIKIQVPEYESLI